MTGWEAKIGSGDHVSVAALSARGDKVIAPTLGVVCVVSSFAFHVLVSVHTRMRSPSIPAHTTQLRGDPSLRSVVKCT